MNHHFKSIYHLGHYNEIPKASIQHSSVNKHKGNVLSTTSGPSESQFNNMAESLASLDATKVTEDVAYQSNIQATELTLGIGSYTTKKNHYLPVAKETVSFTKSLIHRQLLTFSKILAFYITDKTMIMSN